MRFHIYAMFMLKLDTDDSHICRLAVEEQSGLSLIKSYKRLVSQASKLYLSHKILLIVLVSLCVFHLVSQDIFIFCNV